MIRKFEQDIRDAVKKGILKEPFTPQDVKRALTKLGAKWADGTYTTFLPKHKKNNRRGCRAIFEVCYRLLPIDKNEGPDSKCIM